MWFVTSHQPRDDSKRVMPFLLLVHHLSVFKGFDSMGMMYCVFLTHFKTYDMFSFQGTMEEKIYDRQVTKQSLSFRVVDQQQIERHFTTNELAELYTFEPDLLDDPSGKKRKAATPLLPKVKTHICMSYVLNFA